MDYVATYSNVYIQGEASDMILYVDSDAAYVARITDYNPSISSISRNIE